MHPKTILVSTLVIITALFTAAASAQINSGPGPEVKKLDYFIGTWTTEGTIPQGPWGMGGKFTSTRTSEWMPGNFFVESHSDFKMPSEVGGDGKSVSFMGYDAEANSTPLTISTATAGGRSRWGRLVAIRGHLPAHRIMPGRRSSRRRR